ncbi:MAG: C4-type zinc ribbon domain-containing protein [Bacteroidia bacterium]|nr:C4-type zinc ribbon domain-containing protein [Bacteroidia bacterium]
MTESKFESVENKEISVEEKLRALYQLQVNDSKIDKIKILRGELPLEVQDLEDEIVGLETRINNYKEEITNLNHAVNKKKSDIKEANNLIKRFEEQQMNVRNNREFESLSKEIEFQKLEIELCEKRIKKITCHTSEKKTLIDESNIILEERKGDLEHKRSELNDITSETQKEEESLKRRSGEIEKFIEPRLLNAYKRIRDNARNGLAVVSIQRDACGGCFNNIPPQRQLDISQRKKIIVCEYCGRILVDPEIASSIV